jgi:hypothetical protein
MNVVAHKRVDAWQVQSNIAAQATGRHDAACSGLTTPPVSPLFACQHHQNQEVIGAWPPSLPLLMPLR